MGLRDAVVAATHALGIPYGYTIAVWSASALCISKYGVPNLKEVLLFVGGASAGYLLFDLVTLSADPGITGSFQVALPKVAAFNFRPVLPAIATSLALRQMRHKAMAFRIVGFVASASYLITLVVLFMGLGRIVRLRPV